MVETLNVIENESNEVSNIGIIAADVCEKTDNNAAMVVGKIRNLIIAALYLRKFIYLVMH